MPSHYMEDETAEDKKWRAESDARTLADAEAIKADKDRFNEATTSAKGLVDRVKKQAETAKKEAQGMNKIANKSLKYKTM